MSASSKKFHAAAESILAGYATHKSNNARIKDMSLECRRVAEEVTARLAGAVVGAVGPKRADRYLALMPKVADYLQAAGDRKLDPYTMFRDGGIRDVAIAEIWTMLNPALKGEWPLDFSAQCRYNP